MSELATIILAAGKGVRMQSAKAKVLHTICGKPMLWHVVEAAKSVGAQQNIVVMQPDATDIQAAVTGCEFVTQQKQLGTGDAVKAAQVALKNFNGNVIILAGDCPLITPEALQDLLEILPKADIAMLGFEAEDAGAYGRLVVSGSQVKEIVEFKDANAKQQEITLCNSGIYALPAKLLFELLAEVKNNNAKGEYYLTDIVKIAAARGLKTIYALAEEADVLGVNNKVELAQAEAVMQMRLCTQALENGVQMIAPETVFLSADTKFGRDVILKPNVVIGENVEIGDGVEIGPFAHIRAGTKIGAGAKIGNFVEIKNSKIGAGAKVGHLSYIGDAVLGEAVNIGAGTITCNYDGFEKYKTIIEDNVFVGSNTALIAPVKIGAGAIIAAGSTISLDVSADALAISRAEQKNLADGAKRFRSKKSKK